MPAPYALSESDRDWLARLVQDAMSRGVNVPKRGQPDPTNSISPDTYVALTPSTGIPALSRSGTTGTADFEHGADDVPGYADCTLWWVRVDDTGTPRFRSVDHPAVTVYNLSTVAVAGNVPVLVTRDKFGSWYVTSGLAGVETTTC